MTLRPQEFRSGCMVEVFHIIDGGRMSDLRQDVANAGSSATILGVICLLLGMFALFAPGFTGESLMIALGILTLGGGVMRAIWAFGAGSFWSGVGRFLIGVLTIIAGVLMLSSGMFTAAIITTVLTVYLVSDGLSEVIIGFQNTGRGGWFWWVLAGVVSVILGIMVWAGYPDLGVFTLAIFVGIKLFWMGIMLLVGGSTLSAAAK